MTPAETVSSTPARTLRRRKRMSVGSATMPHGHRRRGRELDRPAAARTGVRARRENGIAGPLRRYTGSIMKTGIHPEYVEAHVRCTCGYEFTTRSTQSEIHVEICSNCHPFYTGRQKLVDTGGRVERFRRRQARRKSS